MKTTPAPDRRERVAEAIATGTAVSYNRALLLVIGRKNADRERLYRRFVKEGMAHATLRETGKAVEPTDAELAAVLSRHRKEGFTAGHLQGFSEWFWRWEPSIRRERAQTAAAARWSKKSIDSKKRKPKRAQASRRRR